LAGQICCNSDLLVSWDWGSFRLEQYAHNSRLLYLLVPGNFIYFLMHFLVETLVKVVAALHAC